MRYSIRTIGPVAPTSAIPVAVSLDEAKAHLKVDFATDDALITSIAAAAQDAVERHTGQVLTPRVLEMAAWGFPLYAPAGFPLTRHSVCSGLSDAIELPREPVTSIVSIAYTDGTGLDVDMDDAAWRWSESSPGLLRPAWSTSWPVAANEDGSVRVTFEAGYEAGLCPASLLAAVKLMVGHLYANREEVIADMRAVAVQLPLGVDRLCAPFRKVSL